MAVSAGDWKPSTVTVTFPVKYVLEWATQEANFSPKLMSLVLGNRLQCSVAPHTQSTPAESQSSRRGQWRWIMADVLHSFCWVHNVGCQQGCPGERTFLIPGAPAPLSDFARRFSYSRVPDPAVSCLLEARVTSTNTCSLPGPVHF